MRKIILTAVLGITCFVSFGQINVINSTNGSLTITPKGIRGKLPASSSEDTTNIAIGENSLQNNINAKGNVAFGKNALKTYSFNNGGTPHFTQNTAIGYESLMNTQGISLGNAGSSNTAIGYRTLKNNTTGNENTAIGSYSLNSNTLGLGNIALGIAGLPFNTTGNRNIAIGTIALFTNKANSGSIAIGYLANQYADDRTSNPVETHNIAIGSSALSGQSPAANNIGIRNIAIGSNTLYRYTSGSNNVAIGNFSGNYITSGSGNIMLGNDAGGTINVSNKLFIDNSNTNDPLIKGDFSTNELKINSKLRVGGTGDTPTATLQIDGSVAVTGKIPLTSSQNNLNVAGKSVIRVSGGSLVTLTGLAGGVDGMVIYIYTDGTDLNIPQLSGLSATGNQFHLAGGFPSDTMSITGSGGAHFIYDAENGLWRLIGFKL